MVRVNWMSLARNLDRTCQPVLEPIRPYYLSKLRIFPKGEEGARRFYTRYIGKEDVVLEVGANKGGSTLFLSDLAGFVYAFEPAAPTFRYLRAFTAHRRNVKLFNVGASDKNSVGSLFFNLHDPCRASTYGDEGRRHAEVKARFARLDAISFPRKPTCLVMDCEGSEVDALKGASGLLLAGTIRCVLVETHYRPDGSATLQEVVDLLERMGMNFRIEVDESHMPWVLAQADQNHGSMTNLAKV